MKNIKRFICTTFFSCMFLFGCGTTKGPQPIISASGIAPLQNTGIAGKFLEAEKFSFQDPSNQSAAEIMLEDGFALIYANCSDFFQSAGNTQKWVIFSRDVVGVIGTLATSALALHNASKSAVSNAGLVTSASYLGLDTYTKNFLFASENIESVRTLITNALATHASAVKSKLSESTSGLSYRVAVVALSDHQDICSPMSITALARQAIKKGVVVPSIEVAETEKNLGEMRDENILQNLGQVLNPPGSLDVTQAGALWWLLKAPNNAEERAKYIAPALKDIPSSSSPFLIGADNTVTYKADWPLRTTVLNLLNNFSPGTKKSFNDAVQSYKLAANATTSGSGTAGPAPAVAPAAPPRFSLGSSGGSRSTGHIGIEIR